MDWRSVPVSSFFEELDEWKPVSRAVAWFALGFYVLFLLYATFDRSGFLFLDYANLAIHEAGHPLFGISAGPDEAGFGYMLMILGGTLLELIVPFACAVAFFFRREVTGVAFCVFWFFENFLYIGHYMATARTMDIQVVGSGDHDWEIVFSHWNLLVRDQQIGHATQALGWIGMIATLAWFAFRSFRRPPSV
jgi:hypothetical protein